jgi:hypothetical protein
LSVWWSRFEDTDGTGNGGWYKIYGFAAFMIPVGSSAERQFRPELGTTQAPPPAPATAAASSESSRNSKIIQLTQ